MLRQLLKNARTAWRVRREILEVCGRMADTGRFNLAKMKREVVKSIERRARDTGRDDLREIAKTVRDEWMGRTRV